MIYDPISWGYSTQGKHKTVDEVYDQLVETISAGANLCMNIGVRPDGSLDPKDDIILRKVGAKLKANSVI